MKRIAISVYGEVQGVGFRFHAKEKAKELGIRAEPQNRGDGSVFITAEGEEEALGRFADWCRAGAGFANVERIEVNEIK